MAREWAVVRFVTWTVVVIGVELLLWWMLDLGRPRTALVAAVTAVLLVALLVLWLVRPTIHYRHSAWRLGEDGLELRRGAWWRTETRIPLSRIQHTDVRQGPVQRRHGLGTVAVYTAGTQFNAIELEGLAHEDALALRDRLIEIGESPI